MIAGSKYHRKIIPATSEGHADIYAILEAYDVKCPARQHAIKKLLCAGIRGKGDVSQDLIEAGESVNRSIEMQVIREEGQGS